ncbi:amidohydrolase family protein [Micromonospora humida]|uniref:Amidohydrolase family protein n=1 Tax=Micromonospora humida TaxID=2809018 RepID=A0ABS2IQJ4_9ACTN|nr:amidohydrolase family protein [Micromonospora humida]MBM7075541.1 amidohydrolase family protein [Micromonospora humida]
MWALRATRLFDGERVIERPLLLVAGGAIIAVRERGIAPVGVPLTDLGHVTLLPGLVDAHVHLVLPGDPDPVGAVDVSADELISNARRAANACLDGGITTVRDLGDRDYVTVGVRAESARDPMAGPQLLVSGPPITTEGGHCWFLGGAVTGRSALIEAVRSRVARGVDVIKIMASGGEITPGSRSWQAQYTVDDLRMVVTEAHRSGLPVAAHAHAVSAIERALAAGVDTIEHATFRTRDGVRPDPGLIDRLAAAGTPVTVTTGFSPEGPPLDAAVRLRTAAALRAADDMRRAGVRIVLASDAGISDQKPHRLLPFGIIRLVEAGFPPVEALRAATATAASACGLPRKGRVVPGADADLLAVDGDPTRDIRAVLAVRAVYRGGQQVRYFDPEKWHDTRSRRSGY